MAKEIFNYDGKTKEYLPTEKPVYARVDPRDRLNIPVPRNATLIKPPKTYDNEVAVFVGGVKGWQVEKDFRGTVYSLPDGTQGIIREIGEEPPDVEAAEYKEARKQKAVEEKQYEIMDRYFREQSSALTFDGKEYPAEPLELKCMYDLCLGLLTNTPIPSYAGTPNEGTWRTVDGEYIAFVAEDFKSLYLQFCENIIKAKAARDAALDALKVVAEDAEKLAEDVKGVPVGVKKVK